MIHSSLFLNQCKKLGYTLFTGTPCSYLKSFINYVIDDEELDFIETTNEGDAVALASGAWLGSRKTIVMFQNSGLGNAVNPLTSLSHTMKIPFIGIVTLRGEVGGSPDEPQHELMGKITTDLLDLMEIPWTYFPTEEGSIEDALSMAEKLCTQKSKPFFFVMRKGSVQHYELKAKIKQKKESTNLKPIKSLIEKVDLETRTKAIETIVSIKGKNDVLIATTGKTGRELFEVNDLQNNFYMVGSMGCALPIGIGLSKTNFKNKIYIIDGDGALLMRMGNMALCGQLRPNNIVHILLDNGVHDSTGGQRTYSEYIDFATIASSCGYQNVFETDSIVHFKNALKDLRISNELSFIRLKINPGSPKNLGRPTLPPYKVAKRLRNLIEEINERNDK